ncbi:SlyX protein [Alteromonadaceae bacterium Bs31]|nr:SlyX protein [Alteromonadaceae bacterium Bs31]
MGVGHHYTMNEIEDLQARVAFQEDIVQSLNQEVAELSQQVQSMQKQMKHLNKKLEEVLYQAEQGQSQDGSGAMAEQERPPHY